MNKAFKNIEESLKILNEFNDSSDLNKMIKIYNKTNKLLKNTSNEINDIERKFQKDNKKIYNIKNNEQLINNISKFESINNKIRSYNNDDIYNLIKLNSELKVIYNSIINYLQNKKLEINYVN
jgi:hypothetical protein